MFRIAFGTVLLVVAAAAIFIVWSNQRWAAAIDEDIARLKAGVANEGRIVTADVVAGLPAPVQRYLAWSGVIGKPIPAIVRLTQTGRIRGSADAAWMTLEAEETYSTNPPAFVWKAFLPSRSLPVALGRDEYLDGEGSIFIKMLSVFPVADESGETLREAALTRYLNEMMWFPAALAGDNLAWTDIDDASAKVSLRDRGVDASAIVFFDDEGRIVNFRALRFNTETRRMETWETPITAYGSFAGLNLPAKGSAVWKRSTGDFTYVELEITGVEYDSGR
jgi:hypothetical protein